MTSNQTTQAHSMTTDDTNSQNNSPCTCKGNDGSATSEPERDQEPDPTVPGMEGVNPDLPILVSVNDDRIQMDFVAEDGLQRVGSVDVEMAHRFMSAVEYATDVAAINGGQVDE